MQKLDRYKTLAENEENFPEPGTDLTHGDVDLGRIATLSPKELRDRWDTERGRAILSEWERSGFDRIRLDGLVGRYHGHTDLRGSKLKNKNLQYKELHDIDFYGSDLRGANLLGANLKDSWLSETDIRSTCFDYANMEDVLIDNARFNDKTSFVGVELGTVNFKLAALIKELALGQQRIMHLRRRNPILAFVLRWTCDYGRSMTLFFGWVIAAISIFGVLFTYLPGSISKEGFGYGLYFSVVTFTTLGYGDITPISDLGRLLAAAEVLIGYCMGGLLVAILARRVMGN